MPIHSHILENLHALLDYYHIPKVIEERIQQFASMFSLSLEDSEKVLSGELVPNKQLLKQIADKFEVEPLWLLRN